jgi:hypothetical protein
LQIALGSAKSDNLSVEPVQYCSNLVVSAFTAAGDKNSLLLEPELKVVREFHS